MKLMKDPGKVFIPGVSVDCVIFGWEDDLLKVLLVRWKGSNTWALPGGFVLKEEDLREAALRTLKVRTGLENIYLSQFHTFGKKNRRDRGVIGLKPTKELSEILKSEWLKQRFISIGYLAMVNIEAAYPTPDPLSDACEWISIDDMPQLVYDHEEIIERALTEIRTQLNYLPVGINLLPNKFTMQALQKLYQGILGYPLERSNFQKKMLKMNILKRHEKLKTGGAHKAPYLYSFNKVEYEKMLGREAGLI